VITIADRKGIGMKVNTQRLKTLVENEVGYEIGAGRPFSAMNFIIVDVEATCDKNNTTFPNEIIEIGAVKLDYKGNTVDEFSSFIKPILRPKLTDFCKEFTTIKQSDVDKAQKFYDVIFDFQRWIDLEKPYLICSWGYYDRKQLVKDCVLFGLSPFWIERHHISLKHQFKKIKKVRLCGMMTALKILKLPHNGVHHRGIDDARNIAKIFKALIGQWDLK
jgi:inhibitor of KinA sporulation pathway (predicted exonuclease)